MKRQMARTNVYPAQVDDIVVMNMTDKARFGSKQKRNSKHAMERTENIKNDTR